MQGYLWSGERPRGRTEGDADRAVGRGSDDNRSDQVATESADTDYVSDSRTADGHSVIGKSARCD
jgi:hypothetical protein